MTNTTNNNDPRWAPAKLHLPDALRRYLMWMGMVTVEDRSVHQYKHRDTRKYINLDLPGQAWNVSVDGATGKVTAKRIATTTAIAHLKGRSD